MKKKKLLLTALVPATLFGVASCNSNNASSSTDENSTSEVSSFDDNAFTFTSEGYTRLAAEPGDEIVNSIIDSLISKGGELITGGIQTYAKSIVLNLLKECGFDFRDATTKTLEKIQEQLTVIEKKVDAMAAKQEQYQAEKILGDLLKAISVANNNYVGYVVDGLGDIANYENSDMSEDEIEAKRKIYYDNTVSNLIINGNPFVTYVSDLADYILLPNQADRSKTVFDYYTSTIGVYDTWSTLYLRNVKNFMAYLDSTLVTCANLAKFQMYYKALGMDSTTIKVYSGMMDTMAAKVNAVNALFKAKLDSLKELEDKKDAGINIYMSTGKEYSTRMATLTYNVNDNDGNGDSRQGLLMDYYYYSDGTRGDAYKFAMEYVPDQDFVAKVASDFKTYAGAFCVSTYTIKDYLKYAGFYASNSDLFDKAIGLYNANMYADGAGFLNQDYTYSATYYNDAGEYTRKPIYQVDSYHNWNFDVTRTVFTQLDDSYYLCFATPDGDKQKLDGQYKDVYMKDVMSTVVDKVFYKKYFYDITEANKTGWYLHDCW